MITGITLLSVTIALAIGYLFGRATARAEISRLRNHMRLARENASENTDSAMATGRMPDVQQMETAHPDAETQERNRRSAALIPFDTMKAMRTRDEIDMLLLVAAGVTNEAEMVHSMGRIAFDAAQSSLMHDGIVGRWKTHMTIADPAWRIAPGEKGAPSEDAIRADLIRQRSRMRRFGGVEGSIETAIGALLDGETSRQAVEAKIKNEHRATRAEWAIREVVRRGYATLDGDQMLLTPKAHFEVVMSAAMRELYDALPPDTATSHDDMKALTGWHGAIVTRSADGLVRAGYARRRLDGLVKLPIADRGKMGKPRPPAFAASLNNTKRRQIAEALRHHDVAHAEFVKQFTKGGHTGTIVNMEIDGEVQIDNGMMGLTSLGRILRLHSTSAARLLMGYAAGRRTMEELGEIIPDPGSLTRAINDMVSNGIMIVENDSVRLKDQAYDLSRSSHPTAADIEAWLNTTASKTNEHYGRTDGFAAVAVKQLAQGPTTVDALAAQGEERSIGGGTHIIERVQSMVEDGHVTHDSHDRLTLTREGLRKLAMTPTQEQVDRALDAGPATEHELINKVAGPNANSGSKFGVRKSVRIMKAHGWIADTDDGRLAMSGTDVTAVPRTTTQQFVGGQSFPYPLKRQEYQSITKMIVEEGPQPRSRLARISRASPMLIDRLIYEKMLLDDGGILDVSNTMRMIYSRNRLDAVVLMAITAGFRTTVQIRSLFSARQNEVSAINRLEMDGIIKLVEGAYQIVDTWYAVIPGNDGAPTVEQFKAGVLAESRVQSLKRGKYTGTAADILCGLEAETKTIEMADLRKQLSPKWTSQSIDTAAARLIKDGMIDEKEGALTITNAGITTCMLTPLSLEVLAILDAPRTRQQLVSKLGTTAQLVQIALQTMAKRGYVTENDGIWSARSREIVAAAAEACLTAIPSGRRVGGKVQGGMTGTLVTISANTTPVSNIVL